MARWGTWILTAWAFMISAPEALAACPSNREAQRIQSKKDFYTTTSPGTVALMPNVTDRSHAPIEHEYLVFKEPGTYTLSQNVAKSSQWWLVTNHTREASSPSYLGILILKFFEDELKRPVELVRNKGWHRSQNAMLEEVRDQFSWFNDFFELQKQAGTLEQFDERFVEWHAIPSGSDKNSWDHRAEWQMEVEDLKNSVRKKAGWSQKPIHTLLQARLFRYETTQHWNTRAPLVWDIGTDGLEAIFIKTFSPAGHEFARQYCIILED